MQIYQAQSQSFYRNLKESTDAILPSFLQKTSGIRLPIGRGSSSLFVGRILIDARSVQTGAMQKDFKRDHV
jgi:hypothetical protein